MLTRRLFLHGLLGAAGAALFAPVEKTLWPGADLRSATLIERVWITPPGDRFIGTEIRRYFRQLPEIEFTLDWVEPRRAEL
jgi:hypothetical protein